MLRNVGGVVLGLVVGSIVNMAIISANAEFFRRRKAWASFAHARIFSCMNSTKALARAERWRVLG